MSKQSYVKEVTECSEIPLNNFPRHIEIKQSQCNENLLVDFYMTSLH